MRYFSLLTVFISILSVAPVHADDGLFSEVAMESVFKTSATSPSIATRSESGIADRITGVSSLIEALKAAGFEARESDGRAAFAVDHASWRFPVSIAVQVDQDRLDCRMSLVEIDSDSQPNSKTLLRLLASGNSRGTAFAYDPTAETIQVRASLSNRSITASELKADLLDMARFAERHADLWSALKPDSPPKSAGNSASKSKSSSPTDSTSVTAKPSTGLSLTGRWSASLASDEAFAIEITAESRFKLVHLKSGKSTVSEGKITRSGNRMKLVGENDVTLNCTVTQTSGDAFTLAISDANGNAALTLNFKKAK